MAMAKVSSRIDPKYLDILDTIIAEKKFGTISKLLRKAIENYIEDYQKSDGERVLLKVSLPIAIFKIWDEHRKLKENAQSLEDLMAIATEKYIKERSEIIDTLQTIRPIIKLSLPNKTIENWENYRKANENFQSLEELIVSVVQQYIEEKIENVEIENMKKVNILLPKEVFEDWERYRKTKETAQTLSELIVRITEKYIAEKRELVGIEER